MGQELLITVNSTFATCVPGPVLPGSKPNQCNTSLITHASVPAQGLTGAKLNKLNAVPEPGTIVLLASGLLGLAGYRWQQQRRAGVQTA